MAIEDDKNESEQQKLFSKVKYKITGRVSDEVSFRKVLSSTVNISIILINILVVLNSMFFAMLYFLVGLLHKIDLKLLFVPIGPMIVKG